VTDNLVIDLHTHSCCSDGSLSPGDLVRRASASGLDVLALTDHDTIAGLNEARDAAAEAGIRLVPGVEISASWRGQAIHVLGLWIDPAGRQFRERLDSQAERRRARMRAICARLAKLGLPGAELLAAVEAAPGVPTRTHLAEALRAGGHVDRTDDAFRKYLGRGKPAHLAAEWPAPGAIRVVRRCAPPVAGRFRCGRRWRPRGRHRRQWGAALGSLRRAGGEVRPSGIGRIRLSQPTADLESLGPVP